MALLMVRTANGGAALIHSSQIGPQPVRRETPGEREAAWRAVWARAEAERGGEDVRSP